MRSQTLRKPLALLLSLALALGGVPTQALAEEVLDEEATVVVEDATEDVPVDADVNLTAQEDAQEWVDPSGTFRYRYTVEYDDFGHEGVVVENIDVIGDHEESSLDLIVPDTIDGKPVIALGVGESWVDPLFDWSSSQTQNEAIGSVTIPAAVQRLGVGAFYSSNSKLKITTVTFAEGSQVIEIPLRCFSYLSIESITLPESLQTIGDYAFQSCNNLTSIEIPEGVTSIGEQAFQPSTHQGPAIGNFTYEFVSSSSLESVRLPNSLKSIGRRAFYGNLPLTSVTFGSSMTEAQLETIGDYAFAATSLNSVELPDTVTSIGESAFDWEPINEGLSLWNQSYLREGPGTLASVQLGSSQETSQLRTIGINAFRDASITTIALPNTLEAIGYQHDADRDSWATPFDSCTQLQSIAWPTAQTPQGFTTVGGFWNCWSLSDDDVINNLPSWIDTIDDYAFANTAFTDIVIPDTVTYVGKLAFEQGFIQANGYTDYADKPEGLGLNSLVIGSGVASIGEHAFDSNKLTSLVIKDSTTPLVIGDLAFAYNYELDGVDIVLPKRVSRLGGGTFWRVGDNPDEEDYDAHNSYYIYNKDLTFTYFDEAYEGDYQYDPWWNSGDDSSVVYYPQDAAEDSQVMRMKASYDEFWTDSSSGLRWEPFDADDQTVRHTITATLPAGAVALLEVDYQAMTPELTEREGAQILTARVAEGSNVLLHVYLDDYVDYVISPAGTGEASPLTASWNVTVTTDDMVPLSTTGGLQVKLTGAYATDANVAIIDAATGAVVRQGTAARALVYIAEELPAGTYTVVAYAKNDAFSRSTSLADFELLGFGESDYVTADVTVSARGATEVTLTPPELNAEHISGVLASGEVFIPLSRTVPGIAFSAQIRYEMADGREADELRVSLPEGIEPVLASSVAKKYGVDGYDPDTHTLTLTGLAEADRTSGLIAVGLTASSAAAGNQAIAASVTSGNVTVPVGSAPIEVNALSLDVPQSSLGSTEFDVTVYAAPQTDVRFRIGQTDLDVTCTTNKVGRGTATLTIPEDELSIYVFSYTVTALLDDDSQVSVSDQVYYQYVDEEIPFSPTVRDFSFVHAKEEVVLAKDGKDCSGGYYTVVAVPSAHRDLYSPTWPFTATVDCAMELNDTMVLELGMLDGSVRYETMVLTGATDVGQGVKRYVYTADVAIGDGDIEHPLESKDIPVRFDVVPEVAEGATLPPMSQEAYDSIKQYTVLRGSKRPEASLPANIEALLSTVGAEEWAGIFNESYRHENWSHDSEPYQQWEALPPEMKERYQKIEDLIGFLYDTLAVMMGDKQALPKYASLEDYLYDNYGYQTGQTLSSAALAGEGYRIIQDGDTSSVPGAVTPTATGEMRTPEWVAVRYADVDGFEIEGLETMDESGLTVQQSSSQKAIKLRDANGNAYEVKVPTNVTEATKIPGVSAEDILSNGLDSLSREMEGFKADATTLDVEGIVTSLVANTDTSAGFLATVKASYDAEKKVMHVMSNEEFTERVNELKRLNMMDDYYQKNNPGSVCQRAIQQEKVFLQNYLNDLMQLNPMLRMDASVSAVTAGAGELSMHMSKIGPLKVLGERIGNTATAASIIWAFDSDAAMGDLMRKANYDLAVLKKYRAYRESVCRHDAFGKLHYKKAGILDPSGYVYEGADDARVSDVTATIYQLVDGEWVAWDDAADYDQTNPQQTGEGGLFAWDVPAGSWKARFVKEGYEEAWSQIMDVLPEWTNVAINMIRNTAPTVAELDTVLEDGTAYVDVVFDQYMNIDEPIDITIDGEAPGEHAWLSVQDGRDRDGNEAQLSRTLRVPLGADAQPGSTVQLTLAGAKSYSGMTMEAPYERAVKVPYPPLGWHFIDVDDTNPNESERTPHYEDINWLAEERISTGWALADGSHEFRGMSPVVRQDMAAFLYRLAGSPAYVPTPDDVAAFVDVDGSTPHYTEILWLASEGISQGWNVGGGRREFRGMETVKRQDMAAFLRRLTGRMGGDAQMPDGASNPFYDVDSTNPDENARTPHCEDIVWLAGTGVTTGWDEGNGRRSYRGMNDVVRQDMAAFLHRLDTYIKEHPAA